MIFWQDDVSWQEDNAADAEEVGELSSAVQIFPMISYPMIKCIKMSSK